MTRKSYLIAGLLSVTAVGGVAAATQALRPHGPMRADTNRDGTVSRAEFFSAAEARFAKRDADGNRVLAGSELDQRRGGFARLDADRNGSVTFAEAAAGTSARFTRLDADKDGKLTPAELGPGRAGPGGRFGPAAMLMRADADHDGRLTRDELRAEADRRFDRIDTNKDGVIDRAELAAMPRPPMGPGRGPGHDGPPPPPPPGADD